MEDIEITSFYFRSFLIQHISDSARALGALVEDQDQGPLVFCLFSFFFGWPDAVACLVSFVDYQRFTMFWVVFHGIAKGCFACMGVSIFQALESQGWIWVPVVPIPKQSSHYSCLSSQNPPSRFPGFSVHLWPVLRSEISMLTYGSLFFVELHDLGPSRKSQEQQAGARRSLPGPTHQRKLDEDPSLLKV